MFIPAEFVIMAIGIVEGALSLATDACRGLCDNIVDTFCEQYSAICEYCIPNCRIEDQNGCVDTCNAWKNSTSTSEPIRAIPGQNGHTSDLSTMFPWSSTGNAHTESGTTVASGAPITDTTVGLICFFVVLAAVLFLGLSYLFYKHYTLNFKKIKQCWREENPGNDFEMHECVDRNDGQNEVEGSSLHTNEEQTRPVDRDSTNGQPSRDVQGPETCMTKCTTEEQLSPDSGFKSTDPPPSETRPLLSFNQFHVVSECLQGAVPFHEPPLAPRISTSVQDGTNYSAKVVVGASSDPLAAFHGVWTTTGD